MKITPAQYRHLEALRDGPRSSYPELHMGVLNSLVMKGLANVKFGLGSIAMPHTATKWSLTDEGRAAIAKAAGKP